MRVKIRLGSSGRGWEVWVKDSPFVPWRYSTYEDTREKAKLVAERLKFPVEEEIT